MNPTFRRSLKLCRHQHQISRTRWRKRGGRTELRLQQFAAHGPYGSKGPAPSLRHAVAAPPKRKAKSRGQSSAVWVAKVEEGGKVNCFRTPRRKNALALVLKER